MQGAIQISLRSQGLTQLFLLPEKVFRAQRIDGLPIDPESFVRDIDLAIEAAKGSPSPIEAEINFLQAVKDHLRVALKQEEQEEQNASQQ